MEGGEGSGYWSERNGAWIFLSHSHLDFPRVRVVRNLLEERGHRPLMFFLKCMEDGAPELPELIRREIEARTWFLLCDSPRSRASSWVQEEVEMIQQGEGRVFETVDLEAPLADQVARVDAISVRATVFLNHTHRDEAAAHRLRAALEAAGFDVVGPMDVLRGGAWNEDIKRGIDYALERGFVLSLLSSHVVESGWVQAEAEYARSRQPARVVPVVIDDVDPVSLDPRWREWNWFELRAWAFDAKVSELVRYLKTAPLQP